MQMGISEFVGSFRRFRAGRLMILTAAALLAKSGTASADLVQEPIGVSGFTASTIVDAAASTNVTGPPAHSANASAAGSSGQVYTSSTNVLVNDMSAAGTVHNGGTYFQNGWNGQTTGLPASGSFTSAYTNITGGNTVFDFGYNGTATDYADNNTLYFTASTATSQTLTLVTPIQAATLDFLCAAQLPAGYTAKTQFDVTLNFSSGPSSTYTQAITTGPMGDDGATPAATNKALTGLYGTDNGNSGHTDNAFGGGAYMTESDINVLSADQARTITSITFSTDPLSGLTAGIYAVSGQVIVPEPASLSLLALTLPLLGRRMRRSR
jgi:hypothetical protein